MEKNHLKKYRLIREYPGSPKLDSIVEIKNNGGYELENSTSYFMTKDKVENYPEFWKLVVEKDYEILSLRSLDIIEDLENNETINMLLKQGCSIHSVKRLSDGEIFTIGDLVGTPGFNFPIQEFKIYNDENTVLSSSYYTKIGSGKYNTRLRNLQKSKQKLFTSEDGVDIFEGDKLYTVDKKTIKLYSNGSFAGISTTKHNDYVYFSTKEKAEEYILYNKPVLSLKEIKETTTIKGLSLKKLEKLVQQKLKS